MRRRKRGEKGAPIRAEGKGGRLSPTKKKEKRKEGLTIIEKSALREKSVGPLLGGFFQFAPGQRGSGLLRAGRAIRVEGERHLSLGKGAGSFFFFRGKKRVYPIRLKWTGKRDTRGEKEWDPAPLFHIGGGVVRSAVPFQRPTRGEMFGNKRESSEGEGTSDEEKKNERHRALGKRLCLLELEGS